LDDAFAAGNGFLEEGKRWTERVPSANDARRLAAQMSCHRAATSATLAKSRRFRPSSQPSPIRGLWRIELDLRRFIGWEMNAEYVEIASKRLAAAREQLELGI